MFDVPSRYASTGQTTLTGPDGRAIPYLRRRFLPQPGVFSVAAEVTISQGDRLDLIAARTLGAPELFWMLCDANSTLNPFDLINEQTAGKKIRVPVPQPQDAIPLLNGVSG